MNALFLTDVDGTVLQNPAPIPQSVCEAAAQFRKAGGAIALCTGRAPISARSPARSLGAMGPAVLYGGAALYDFSCERFLTKHFLPSSADIGIRRAMEEFPQVSVLAYGEEDIFRLRCSPFTQQKGIADEVLGPACTLSDVSGGLFKVVLVSEDVDQLTRCGQLCFGDICEVARGSSHFMEVVPSGADKGRGVQALAQLLGLDRSRLFGAGDGMTDLPLLQQAGRSYTMPNSPRELKDCADRVLPSVHDGGMALAFLEAADLIRAF